LLFYDPESTLDVPISKLPANMTDPFALEVQGDSMIDALIGDGDYVILRPAKSAEYGQMVAALVNGETTLKYDYREGKRIRLQPANPAYKPLILDEYEYVCIQGQVVMLYRKYF
jgi:repressor LexA